MTTLGGNDEQEAIRCFQDATHLRRAALNALDERVRQNRGLHDKPDRELTESDFDDMVTFWSR